VPSRSENRTFAYSGTNSFNTTTASTPSISLASNIPRPAIQGQVESESASSTDNTSRVKNARLRHVLVAVLIPLCSLFLAIAWIIRRRRKAQIPPHAAARPFDLFDIEKNSPDQHTVDPHPVSRVADHDIFLMQHRTPSPPAYQRGAYHTHSASQSSIDKTDLALFNEMRAILPPIPAELPPPTRMLDTIPGPPPDGSPVATVGGLFSKRATQITLSPPPPYSATHDGMLPPIPAARHEHQGRKADNLMTSWIELDN